MASNSEVRESSATVSALEATASAIKKAASRRALNRRRFMSTLGIVGAASGAALVANKAINPPSVKALGPTQTDVLNFALNLEYLEATFYSFITQGVDLPPAVTVGSGTVWNQLAKVTFPNQQITDLMNELYYDELGHLLGLRNLLGSSAIARPTLDLLGTNNAKTTTATITAPNALSLARTLEDTGVTAYTGAATLLSGQNLTFASQVLAVEGFHSGALRFLSIQQAAPYTPTYSFTFTGNTTSGSTIITSASSVSFLVAGQVISGPGIPNGATVVSFDSVALTVTISANATATGTKVSLVVDDSTDVKPGDLGTTALASAGPANVAGTTTQYTGFFATTGAATTTGAIPAGEAFARTTSQVLSVVYATSSAIPNAGITKGGFFPSGVNGIITTI